MKKIILFAVLILPFSVFAQQSFTIKGKAGALKDGKKVYLSYFSKTGNVLDSSTINKGQFSFKGRINEPSKGTLSLKPEIKGDKKDALVLYLEPATILIAVADSLKYAQITGSAVNADEAVLRELAKSAQDEINTVNVAYQKATPQQKREAEFMRSFSKRYTEATEKLLQIQLAFAKAHPNSFVSIEALTSLASKEKLLDEAEKVFLALSPEVRQTKAGKAAAETFTAAQKTKIGQPAITIIQNDVNGKPVSLADFKGKYVLIDFWASWCVPCRKENPHLVKAYHQFKDKGFTILGISLDKPDARDAWIKAIADDQLEWPQVSDLKFWDNEAARAYGVKSIPSNFLIDPNGKIIAKGLRGERLATKLAELIGSETNGK
ncbi:TlpA disulfide reductase family protein [Pedobacter sp. ASV28]|uniref:TlpA disulfide reductase family protein n=1 Tax=Pedobacter sp. ASV28 TaxID=2795123 RepID=UPI0018EC1245|nr:TlpA disulfide reductase family protein [Pedobacter sp. ASV28]